MTVSDSKQVDVYMKVSLRQENSGHEHHRTDDKSQISLFDFAKKHKAEIPCPDKPESQNSLTHCQDGK